MSSTRSQSSTSKEIKRNLEQRLINTSSSVPLNPVYQASSAAPNRLRNNNEELSKNELEYNSVKYRIREIKSKVDKNNSYFKQRPYLYTKKAYAVFNLTNLAIFFLIFGGIKYSSNMYELENKYADRPDGPDKDAAIAGGALFSLFASSVIPLEVCMIFVGLAKAADFYYIQHRGNALLLENNELKEERTNLEGNLKKLEILMAKERELKNKFENDKYVNKHSKSKSSKHKDKEGHREQAVSTNHRPQTETSQSAAPSDVRINILNADPLGISVLSAAAESSNPFETAPPFFTSTALTGDHLTPNADPRPAGSWARKFAAQGDIKSDDLAGLPARIKAVVKKEANKQWQDLAKQLRTAYNLPNEYDINNIYNAMANALLAITGNLINSGLTSDHCLQATALLYAAKELSTQLDFGLFATPEDKFMKTAEALKSHPNKYDAAACLQLIDSNDNHKFVSDHHECMKAIQADIQKNQAGPSAENKFGM